MQIERRSDNKRQTIHKHLEIVKSEKNSFFSGYTKDLSNFGIRARFDNAPELGANVLLRLYWVDDTPPIEQRGKVVWTAPDIYGDGVDVGLILQTNDDLAIATEQKCSKSNVTAHTSSRDKIKTSDNDFKITNQVVSNNDQVVLNNDQIVLINANGFLVEAQVKQIGEVDNKGNIAITLSVCNEMAPSIVSDNNQVSINPEDWTPHPFRDAWNTISRFINPIVTRTYQIGFIVYKVMAIVAVFIWNKLPIKWRKPISSFGNKILHRIKIRFVKKTFLMINRLFSNLNSKISQLKLHL